MKRVLSAAAALSAMAVSTQAQAADFILSSTLLNTIYAQNFYIQYADATSSSAFLSHHVGDSLFTDNFFFAPVVPNSIGSGSATANNQANLTFAATPAGLTISGYLLTGAAIAALTDAFTTGSAASYDADVLALLAESAGVPDYFQTGTTNLGGTEVSLTTVPLSSTMFYKITFTGEGTSAGSLYSGNLSSTAVPEPTTWALMLAGFGAIGFAMRRQRKAQPKVRFAF